MRHRLFHTLALPLLWAAVLLALGQAWQAPLVGPETFTEIAFGTETKTAPHERAPAAVLSEGGLWSLSDLLSEDPEWPQAALSAARAHPGRATLLAAATPPWPFRGPDVLLRPPTVLHCA